MMKQRHTKQSTPQKSFATKGFAPITGWPGFLIAVPLIILAGVIMLLGDIAKIGVQIFLTLRETIRQIKGFIFPDKGYHTDGKP